ncbi:hypothetical protein AA0472_2462 [Acetobacter estunensis NRIC 0472]|uniref:Uncharacterized protein n=1 Tax=Acetobacter estunensis TaxID=104097 RepID=A0A967EI64_9PROT|nr:hypothetical protein [Acetobacter estunensis]NHO54922.1 hypothetical protein [Acetobacter estunensis]GBQ27640.1 hypothetical protein AA0472_2462 [Acetobacter estunensis NRIC 0472]
MDVTSAITFILQLIPSSELATATAIVSFIIASCALAVRFWKPPTSTSRWAGFYRIVSALAQARGWNANTFPVDRKPSEGQDSSPAPPASDAKGSDIKETHGS